MTNRTPQDDVIDRLSNEVLHEEMSDAQVDQAKKRVWDRITSEVAAEQFSLSSCADYQALILKLLDNSLPDARVMLVKDHMRECVPCRRALMDARSGKSNEPQLAHTRGTTSLPRFVKIAAAAILVLGTTLISYNIIGNVAINRNLQAAVQEIDGGLHVVSKDTTRFLFPGATIRADENLRTSKNSGATIKLEDGSVIEMDERSEIHLNKSRKGTTINLARGNIIVHAAKQGSGHLYVNTADCQVAVKGTVFTVTHGLKGSRVSVLEGEVEVSQGSSAESLLPGAQMTTDFRLAPVPLEEEIAWSRNAEQHRALLRELGALQRDMAKAADTVEARTSTRLLELAPPDTLIYAGIPNLTEGLTNARSIFDSRLSSSPVLGEWWQSNVVDRGIDDEIEDMLNRLQSLGEAVGEEVAIAVPTSAITAEQGPLVLAELENPASFETLLAGEVERLNAEAGDEMSLVIVDDPSMSSIEGYHLYLWVNNDIFAAALEMETLSALSQRMNSGGDFLNTRLYGRLATAYASGVEWIFGMDVQEIFENAASGDADSTDLEIMRRLGLLDATTLLIERSSDDGLASTSAVLDFDGPRRGMAAWLAEPAPMGSLDFISPDASMAASVVAKDAAEMFDELLTTLASINPEAIDELRDLETNYDFDLRADLVATLGGEATFALDGPILPIPSWKLIVEVYDPGTLNATIERAVDEINRALESEAREERIARSTQSLGGRDYVMIGLEGGLNVFAYTIIDGFMVAGTNSALIEQTIQFRDSGLTLPNSQTFRELLPANGYSDCSAISYRNLGALGDILSAGAAAGLPSEVGEFLNQSSIPSLYCIYGETNRIILEGSGGSLFGLAPLMGLSSMLDDLSGIDVIDDSADVSS